jgi:uncharacterized protein YkwD
MRHFSVFILAGLFTLAGIACAHSGRAQATDQTSGAEGSPARTQTTDGSSTKRTGVWHHFGEENGSTREPKPGTGVWRHFGTATSATRPLPAASRITHTNHATPARKASAAIPRPAAPRPQYAATGTREMERQMFELINRDRLESGGGRARPLRWNEKLAEVARAHSLDMIRRGYFDHVSPGGQTVIDRLGARGIAWQAEGENIAIDEGAAQAESAFMNEPRHQHNHRWNILNLDYTDVGVGIVRGPRGEYYITQDFIESPAGR